MVVMNDRIVSAYYVTKTNANTMDTFKAFEMGNLGQVVSDKPYFFFPPSFPTGRHVVDVRNVTSIPRVDIPYADTDMPVDLLHDSVRHGAKGIVIGGAGAGGVTTNFSKAAEKIAKEKSIPFVFSYRTGSGEVPAADVSEEGIASGYLNPQKSRILLELLLAKGYNTTEIKNVFAKGTD
ncbi:serine/threonine protein kinase, CMGC, CDC2/CDK sub [Ascosphaera pollenicola]|nr:serine/threonine protein kinase, CMGC, CDC2/CDK sub [Ascosphaera pollenicola]